MRISSILALIALGTGCAERDPAPPAASAASEPTGLARDPFTYPLGAWRRDRERAHRAILRPAHILVAHNAASSDDNTVFGVTGASRSRQEALELAFKLHEELKQHPERFAELARKHSDDKASATRAGSLGNVYVDHVLPEMVDALSTLSVGQLSEVFETSRGFHVMQRQAVPPAVELSGHRLVLKYGGTRLWPRARHAPERTREEALELASRIYQEAKANPERFASLVAEHSESYDALQGGDMGVWSTHSFVSHPQLQDLIAETDVGGITQPVDTYEGVVIVKRRAVVSPVQLAASIAIIPYKDVMALHPDVKTDRTRDEALLLATGLAKQARRKPQTFGQLVAANCIAGPCMSAGSFPRADGDPAVVAELEKMRIGEVSEPFEGTYGIYLTKRLDPKGIPVHGEPLRTLYALPEPPSPEMIRDVMTLPNEELAESTKLAGQELSVTLGLRGEQLERFRAIYDQLARGFRESPREERGTHAEVSKTSLTALLGEHEFQRYESVRNAWYDARQARASQQ